MYFINLYKDFADEPYCLNDEYSCVGLYSNKEDAEKRAKELTNELLEKGFSLIKYCSDCDKCDGDCDCANCHGDCAGEEDRFYISIIEIKENVCIDWDNRIVIGRSMHYE